MCNNFEFISAIRLSEIRSYRRNDRYLINTITLDDPINDRIIYKSIPRAFEIRTKNGSCFFNKTLIENISDKINDHLVQYPDSRLFQVSLEDNKVLKKVEEMCQGEIVTFKKKEIDQLRDVINILHISNFPSDTLDNDTYEGNGITIYSSSNFFKDDLTSTLTICTNKNQYICNKNGLFSSEVIKEFMEENPDSPVFKYEYDDEFNEFQKICDFFNFENILITTDIVDFLQKIAEDLKIDIILKKVDRIQKEQGLFSSKIDDCENLAKKIDDIFSLLYKIDQSSIEKVKNLIIGSEWSNSEEDVIDLAAFVIQVAKSESRLHESIAELIIRLNSFESKELKILVPFVKNKVMDAFFKDKNLCSFVYCLYRKGVVTKDELLDKLKNEIKNDCLYTYFLPELLEVGNFDADFLTQTSVKNFYPDNMELYKSMRESGEPSVEIARALKHDDVDTFQRLNNMLQNNKFSKASITPTIFESFNHSGSISHLNYSAAYGSIKCFKYLMLNQSEIETSTFYYSIYGGNIEIITIVDNYLKEHNKFENNPQNDDYNRNTYFYNRTSAIRSFDEIILYLIKNHQYSLFDWIFENKIDKFNYDDRLKSFIDCCILNGNAHALIAFIDKGFNILFDKNFYGIAAKNGFYHFLQVLYTLNIDNNSKNNPWDYCSYWSNDNSASNFVSFGSLNIFKFYVIHSKNINGLGYVLESAIDENQTKMLNYFFNKHSDKITNDLIRQVLIKSLQKSDELFYSFVEKFKEKSPSEFGKLIWNSSLLEAACKYGRVKPFYTIIGSIKKLNDILFTICFSKAAISGSMEILNYIIDHNFHINFMAVFREIANASNVSREAILFVFNKSGIELNEAEFLPLLLQAVKGSNTNFVEFLCEKNVFYDELLIDSVNSLVFDLVNVVLKYYSSPAFVNRGSPDGTALHIAAKKNSLGIVKSLLSVPCINPFLCDKDNCTPFMCAARQENYTIIKEFLNSPFRNNFVSHEESLRCLLESIYRTNKISAVTQIYEILDLILNIENIGFSVNEKNMIYFVALFCQKNMSIEIIKKFLKNGLIDINAISIDSGNTFLISAIQSQRYDIVDLLINDPRTDVNKIASNLENPLFIAVKNNNLRIVSKLLSVPSINPYVYNKNGKTPFMIAADNSFLSIIKEFLMYCNKNSNLDIETMHFILNMLIKKVSDKDKGTTNYNNSWSNNWNNKNINIVRWRTNNWHNNSHCYNKRPNKLNEDLMVDVSELLEIFLNIPNIESIFDEYHQNIIIEICSSKGIDIKIVQLFLKIKSLDINSYSPRDGSTPLMESIKAERDDIFNLLMKDPRININLTNYNNDDSALTIAVKQNKISIVRQLIDNEKFDPKLSRANYAFVISKGEITNLLLSKDFIDINDASLSNSDNYSSNLWGKSLYYSDYGSYSNVERDTILLFSAKNGDLKKFELIMNHPKFDIEKADIPSAVGILLEKLNMEDTNELFKFLCQKGLINEIINNEGLFDNFIKKDNRESIDYLLNESNGIKFDIEKLFINALSKNLDFAKLILAYDRKHDNIIDFKKDSYLSYKDNKSDPTEINYNEIVGFVVQNGGQVNQPGKNGLYPLQVAIEKENLNLVEALINTKMIDFNKKIVFQRSCHYYYYQCYDDEEEDEGEKIEKKELLETYLHYAAMGSKRVFKMILKSFDWDINVKDSNNETPLMRACYHLNGPVISHLFKFDNLDFHCRNNSNKDALDIVKKVVETSAELNDDEVPNDELTKSQYLEKILILISSED